MIKKVTVFQKSDESDAFTMVLTDPKNVTNHSGFAIDKIDGLGPVEADINVTEMVHDGDLYNSSRIGKRNIVVTLIFYGEGGTDIEDLRQKTYKLFPTKKLVYLKIETDNHTTWTRGYVEHNEPDIFSEEEKSEISIICPDPKMYSVDNQHMDLVAGSNTIEYEGDVEVGTIITITIGTDITRRPVDGVPAFSISSANDSDVQSIDIYTPDSGFQAGDSIIICSISGRKDVYWTDEAGADHNALNLINQDPKWITMRPGTNNILVVDNNSAIDTISIENSICYEGV